LNKSWANTTKEVSQIEVEEHGNIQMDVGLNQDTQESRVADLGVMRGLN
jgi:hypothetical protein